MPVITIANKSVLVSDSIAQAVKILQATPKGAFATIHDYESKDTISDINFRSRFSYLNYNAKKKELLKELKFEELEIKDEKLVLLSELEQNLQFNECVAKMIESIDKTKDGDRSDNHRKAADKFYLSVAPGIKLKLKTMVIGGETLLVKNDGIPEATSIQLSMVERSRTYKVKGEYKKVNSGNKVRMDKEIAKVLKKKGLGTYKTITLGNNFSTLNIGGKELV